MIIKTKYNIGDKVWVMNNNKPEQVIIVKIVINVYNSICERCKVTNISYYTDNDNEIYAAENIYSTKDELKEAVFN